MERTELFIGNAWMEPIGGGTLEVVSPHSEERIGVAPAASPADVDRAVEAGRRAMDEGPWPHTDPKHRVALVRQLADLYAARRREFATLITAEMGAPISFSKLAQATLPWSMLNAFADLAESHRWEETRAGHYGSDVRIRREPVGVVGAIIPWNMPQFLMVSKLAPALLAGCAIVIKPASETPLDALLLGDLVAQLDLPEGVVSVVPGGRDIGEHLVRHRGVDKISFTGSTAAGRDVAAACGHNLKRMSLELGGKSAAIVLDDAAPDAVAEGLKTAGLMNSGQACVAQTRILVPAASQDVYVEALVAMMEGLVVGDPMDKETEIGPLVAQRQQRRVTEYIDGGVHAGAKLVTGGTALPSGVERGWYVQPTLFADVDNSMVIAREEIFGPVLSVIPYRDEAEAVQIANDSDYGLSGSVWTDDHDRGLAIATAIRAGSIGVNQPYSMDPAAPFGGVKASGFGREMGHEGLDEYTQTKSISID
jgi:acyl-CoA reductase-like NAD-dependent aldehyde dehydrogenase